MCINGVSPHPLRGVSGEVLRNQQFLFIQNLNDDVTSGSNTIRHLLRRTLQYSILYSTIFKMIAIIVPVVCHPERSEGSMVNI